MSRSGLSSNLTRNGNASFVWTARSARVAKRRKSDEEVLPPVMRPSTRIAAGSVPRKAEKHDTKFEPHGDFAKTSSSFKAWKSALESPRAIILPKPHALRFAEADCENRIIIFATNDESLYPTIARPEKPSAPSDISAASANSDITLSIVAVFAVYG